MIGGRLNKPRSSAKHVRPRRTNDVRPRPPQPESGVRIRISTRVKFGHTVPYRPDKWFLKIRNMGFSHAREVTTAQA